MLYCQNKCGNATREKDTWKGWLWVVDTAKEHEPYNQWSVYCGWDCLATAADKQAREAK